jgi:hypothetical protein
MLEIDKLQRRFPRVAVAEILSAYERDVGRSASSQPEEQKRPFPRGRQGELFEEKVIKTRQTGRAT